jgi:hypothetical protein
VLIGLIAGCLASAQESPMRCDRARARRHRQQAV